MRRMRHIRIEISRCSHRIKEVKRLIRTSIHLIDKILWHQNFMVSEIFKEELNLLTTGVST